MDSLTEQGTLACAKCNVGLVGPSENPNAKDKLTCPKCGLTEELEVIQSELIVQAGLKASKPFTNRSANNINNMKFSSARIGRFKIIPE